MPLTTARSAPSEADPGTAPECLSEFRDWLQQSGMAASRILSICNAGRRLLTWLQAEGIGLDGIDNDVLRRFRQHDCRCTHAKWGHFKRRARSSRQYMSRVVELVRCLEQTGRTAHPGELEEGFRLADDFVLHCAAEGYTTSTLTRYRSGYRHFLTWLHGARIPMREMANAHVLSSFLQHDCLCAGGFQTPVSTGTAAPWQRALQPEGGGRFLR